MYKNCCTRNFSDILSNFLTARFHTITLSYKCLIWGGGNLCLYTSRNNIYNSRGVKPIPHKNRILKLPYAYILIYVSLDVNISTFQVIYIPNVDGIIEIFVKNMGKSIFLGVRNKSSHVWKEWIYSKFLRTDKASRRLSILYIFG